MNKTNYLYILNEVDTKKINMNTTVIKLTENQRIFMQLKAKN